MKFFKSLLIAPAALGLMAPVAVNADTAFSPTSKLKTSVNFTVGSNQDAGTAAEPEDELHSSYELKLKSTTSFTGKDKLVGKFELGSGKTLGGGISPQSSKGDGEYFELTDLYYQFPLADDLKVSFGPKMDGDQGLAGTTTLYSEPVLLAADGYYALAGEGGVGATIAYAGDNGWNTSLNFTAADGDKADEGIFGDDTEDYVTAQLGYDGDGFGGTLTYSDSNDTYTAYGVGAYFQPETMPFTVSAYYDSYDPETGDDDENWVVGVEGDAGPGTLGVGVGTQKGDGDKLTYEAWYEYKVTDGVKITPMIWTSEDAGVGGEDLSGAAVNVKYKF